MKIDKLTTAKPHPRRQSAPLCFVVHSTGSLDRGAVVEYYTKSGSGVCPHFLLLPEGDVLQFVETDHVAYHVGLPQERLDAYRRGREEWTRHVKDGVLEAPFAGYQQWFARWPGKESPLQLRTGEHPNGNSIGIELLAERGRCTDRQYTTLEQLLEVLSGSAKIELGRETVIGHSDADPIARSDKHGGTDPGPHFDWERLFALFE